jgi:hypothetical protein
MPLSSGINRLSSNSYLIQYVNLIKQFNLLSYYGGFAEGVHLFPYQTEKLSPSWPMVLHQNAGE